MAGRRFGGIIRQFGHDRRGNVATIFALSAVPAILLVGASVDYTRSVTRKTSLQQATDATVLSVAHDLTLNVSTTTMNANAKNYFAAAVDDPNAWIYSGPTVSPDNTQVCLTGRTTVPTMIMSAASGMGMGSTKSVTVVATSCAKINNISYEVAMVLDNSGSMAESTSGTTKIASLQTAATQMVATLNPSGVPPKASFALVPFSLAVNVGSQYRGASWIDNSGQSSIAGQNYLLPQGLPSGAFLPTSRFALFDAMGQSWGGCVEERPGSYLYSDAPATSGDSLYEPYLAPDEASLTANASLESSYKYSLANDYLSDKSTTSACAKSGLYAAADASGSKTPVYNNVLNPSLPRGDTQTMVCKYSGTAKSGAVNFHAYDYSGSNSGFKTGPNLLCDSQAITTLTNNNTTLNTAINAMYAKGSTNLFSGVMWGWHSISPNGPFNTQTTATGAIGPQNAKAYSLQTNVKVMILMTDGFNSWNTTYGYGTSQPYGKNQSTYSPFGYFENSRLGTTTSSNWRSVMDAATLQACSNAKAAGVQIYTVGFSIPSDPIDQAGLNLLQSCATQPSMAYIAQDGNGLISTFASIAQAMSGLRLVN